MTSLEYVVGFAFVMGACLGSFLNVCIYRLPLEKSVVSPPSSCPSCDSPIAWHDNLPIIGFLLLLGRCRSCRSRISIRYPLVEAATGSMAAFSVASLGFGSAAWIQFTLLYLLLGIALTDLADYIIPDEFSVGGAAIGLGASFLHGGIEPLSAFLSAALGFALFYALAAVGERIYGRPALGGGDIKMMAMLGAFLGTPRMLLTVFLGSILGVAVFGPISWKSGKLIPFGVFLSAGAFVSWFWGDAMIRWYLDVYVS